MSSTHPSRKRARLRSDAASASQLHASQPRLPGWQLPLDHHETAHPALEPRATCAECGFTRAGAEIADQTKHWEQETMTVLERHMIEVISKITDKPRWHEKVFDPKIVERWTQEAKLLFDAQNQQDIAAEETPDSLVWLGVEGRRDDPEAVPGSELTEKAGKEKDEESPKDSQMKDTESDEGTDGGEEPGEEAAEEADEEEETELFHRLELATDNARQLLSEYYEKLPQPMSDEALEFCFEELKHKARQWRHDGLISTIGLGGADIIKSDTVVPEDLREKFASLVKDLEASIEVDWHPGQEGVVRDLVHPSLYPLHFGHSRVTASVIPLESYGSYTGDGDTLALPETIQKGAASEDAALHARDERRRLEPKGYSLKFQWLPAEVRLEDGQATFTSYINNLEYPRYSELYETLAQLIQHSIPLWERCLATSAAERQKKQRRHDVTDEDRLWGEDESKPVPPTPEKFFWTDLFIRGKTDDEEGDDYWQERWELFHRKPLLPPPAKFEEWIESNPEKEAAVSLAKEYPNLQVIVKLANIELSPEKPEYTGGSWHVEGLANEHICATSIFYYDTENVTESKIEFRCGGHFEEDEYSYQQNEFQGLERVYGTDLRSEEAILELGAVSTPQGRLLAFPNVFQHRVHPFELVDRAKPGHRKIAVLWLVNPQKRIISTAHVPPQQREKHESLVFDATLPKFPAEIGEMITDGAVGHLHTAAQAKANRLLLMDERKAPAANFSEIVASYNFCEH